MKKMLKTITLALILVAPLAGAPAVAQSACLSQGEIRQAVAAGQILSLAEILSRGGVSSDSKVLDPVEVCDRGGQLFYQLSILDKDGNARKLVLNAVTGAS